MKVAESAVAQVAAQARPESQSAAKPKPQSSEKPQTQQTVAPDTKPDSGSSVVVSFTSQKSDVVERQNAPKPESQPAASNSARPDEGAKQTEQEGSLSRNIGRDYSVDHGQVVVKVIDRDSDEVVREIPPEELRRIKQAISEINRNSVVSVEKKATDRAEERASENQAKAQPEHGVDVTT